MLPHSHHRTHTRGGIYNFRKKTRKLDLCEACNKISKTTAFSSIITLILDISYT